MKLDNRTIFIDWLRGLIGENHSVLDLGSGVCGPVCRLKTRKHTTVDIWSKIKSDVRHDLAITPYPFYDNSYQIVVAFDCIEHLEKDAGFAMLKEMERIARTRIIISTPTIWTTNEKNVKDKTLWCYGNNYDYHKSFWERLDFSGPDWHFKPRKLNQATYWKNL